MRPGLFYGLLITISTFALVVIVAGAVYDVSFTKACAVKGGQTVRLAGGGRVCAKLEVMQ